MAFEIRSTAKILLVFVFAAVYQVEKSAGATTYVVGDSVGWTIPAGGAGSYASWASGHTFLPGDVLVFNFPTGIHDVAKVDKASFDSCSASNPTTLATVGPATITLTTAGDHFFICTFGQHCSLGQKLTLKVSGSSSTSPPAPSPNATASTPPPTSAATPPSSSTKPLAPSSSSASPPTAAAAAPKATPSTPSSSPPTAAAPKAATPSTTPQPPAISPAITPSSATPPSTGSISPTISPTPTSVNPGGPEVPSSALSPGGSGPGGPNAAGPGPSASSTPPPSGSATKIDAVCTLLGLIVAIAGGIAFVGY